MSFVLRLLCAVGIVCSLSSVNTSAGVITFEDMPTDYWFHGGKQNFGDYWEGVNFGPASTILESEVYGYNDEGYPAHSGKAVLFSIEVPYIDATFNKEVDNVSMWYSSYGNFVLEAYDANDNLITFSDLPGNMGTNSIIEVSSTTKNIKRVRMHDTGNYFTIDDFQAEFVSGKPSSVPEPATAALMLLGLSSLAFFRKRS